MDLVGKTLGNRYEVLQQVGAGGMATVYKAKCMLLNRFVAIKVLKDEFSKDNEFVKRFRAEAQSAASLTHPNIVSVYDVGEENGINYIVMELLQGDTLKDYIDKNGRLSNEITLKFASQIASALEAAHSSKIIHRDIKPQNIVLANNNTIAKVTDFGIAKMSSKDTITSSSSTIGSVHYFSPEHAKGCYTDEKSDIYSLGVVMYEMATGVLPFNAESPVTVALKQIQEEPVEPKEVVSTISDSLNSIILKAMAKNTSDRYQSATELLDDIFAAINSRGIETTNSRQEMKDSNTQVIPIIGLRDDVKPSIADERDFEGLSSRKLIREGKKITDIDYTEINENKKKKRKIAKRIVLWSILSVSIIAIGILLGILINNINRNQILNKLAVEVAPKLVGEKYEVIKAKYEALGLRVSITRYEESDTVAEGYVISQSIDEGVKLTDNNIEVVVSKGVKKVEMIEVVGKEYTVAKYELESIGFKPEFKFVKNEEVKKNLIISQDIKKGEKVPVGSTINIEVSEGDGKVYVVVPNVVGETLSSAKKSLSKLKVSVKYTTDTSKADGVVISQSVKENMEIEEKSAIEIIVNRLQKTKTVTINLNQYVTADEIQSVKVKITAHVEGVTNVIHNQTHQKIDDNFEEFTIDVNGFTTAKITIYVDNEQKEEQTISF